MRWLALMLCLLTTACAGAKIPFTEHRAFRYLIQSSRKEINSKCLSLEEFSKAATTLDSLHLNHRKNQEIFLKEQFLVVIGEGCSKRLVQLTPGEIKNELYGDLQQINDPEVLKSLGGMVLYYEDVVVHSGVRPTFHLESNHSGPKRKLVIVYKLDTNEVIHFGYTGTDNVDEKDLYWPMAEFFKELFSNLGKLAI